MRTKSESKAEQEVVRKVAFLTPREMEKESDFLVVFFF